jgi:ABC-type antimicrobial peptide transport system permease subunit
LLEQDLEPGVLPAIGDFNSVVWILHLGLGEDILLYNSAGEEVKLRLVGLLQTSIFQSELLISESNFLKHFSNQSGYRYFLVQTPPENVEQLSAILESRLRNFGYDATSTTQKLAGYQAVENTYLSTFQTLGGLGLVLGTIGLGIILLRNVMERRGELATLRAFGFRRSTLSTMLLAENGFLLLIGLLIGALSALLAVAPHLMAPGVSVPWTSLLLTLALVFLIGILSSAAAAYLAMRIPLLPALKRE